MPSLHQVTVHNQMEEAKRDEEARRQQQLAAQQAELQRQRDQMMANYAATSQQQQAGIQSQQMNQQAQIQYGRDILQGDISSQQINQQAMNQGLAQQRQNQFTQQRDVNLAGYDMQRATHQASLEAQLNQTRLDQNEEKELLKMRRAIATVDADVRRGHLSAEEGAAMRIQLETGISPLEQRQRQAAIMQAQVQTAGIHQQNEMTATLFNQQQQIRSMNPEQRMRMFRSPDGREQLFQLGANGEWMPMDFGEIARREEGHQMGLLQGASGLLTEGQRRQQSGDLHPFQMQLARGNVENLAATTASIVNATNESQAIHPYRIQQMQTGIANERQRLAAQIQQYEANEQIIPRDLARRDQELANMQWALQEHQALFPGRRDEQGLRNAGLSLQNESQETQNRFNRTTFNERVRSVGLANGLNEAQLTQLQRQIDEHPETLRLLREHQTLQNQQLTLANQMADQTLRRGYSEATIRQVNHDATETIDRAIQNGALRRTRQPGETPEVRDQRDREFRDEQVRRETNRRLQSMRPDAPQAGGGTGTTTTPDAHFDTLMGGGNAPTPAEYQQLVQRVRQRHPGRDEANLPAEAQEQLTNAFRRGVDAIMAGPIRMPPNEFSGAWGLSGPRLTREQANAVMNGTLQVGPDNVVIVPRSRPQQGTTGPDNAPRLR